MNWLDIYFFHKGHRTNHWPSIGSRKTLGVPSNIVLLKSISNKLAIVLQCAKYFLIILNNKNYNIRIFCKTSNSYQGPSEQNKDQGEGSIKEKTSLKILEINEWVLQGTGKKRQPLNSLKKNKKKCFFINCLIWWAGLEKDILKREIEGSRSRGWQAKNTVDWQYYELAGQYYELAGQEQQSRWRTHTSLGKLS